jgi:hypothetical protein
MTERRPNHLEPTFPLWVLWKWKWTVLAISTAVSAISVALFMTRAVKYEAVAVLAPEIHHVPGDMEDPRLFPTYMEVARQALLMHVQLINTDAAIAAIGKASHTDGLEAVRARLRTELAREPMTLRIAAWDEQPERAAVLANAAANYAIAHISAKNARIDGGRQISLDKLRAEFEQRLAIEAQTRAQAWIQADLTNRQHLIITLRDEVAKLEKRRDQAVLHAKGLPAIDEALSTARDELNRLEDEQTAADRALERLSRETRQAALAYETAYAEYAQSSLSLVSRMADLRLSQPAEVPRHPMAQQFNIIAAIGALSGLMIGALAVLYIEYVRSSLR